MKITTALRLAAAAFLTLTARAEEPSKTITPLPDATRVACIGDSITAGVGAEEGRSYPAQLQELLGKKWSVGNFGVSGTTILRKGDYPYWQRDKFTEAQAFQPKVVIIMLGTNDTKPQNWVNRSQFSTDYSDLVKIFLKLPSKPQVYICRPTLVREPGLVGINETNIQAELKMIDQLAAKLPVKIIDMHAALQDEPKLLPDNVHPSTEGAALMAKAAYKVITAKENAPVEKNILGWDNR